MKIKEISVPISWLKSLAKISAKASKDQKKWNKTTKELMPESISMLIGYSSSAKTILKYNENKIN